MAIHKKGPCLQLAKISFSRCDKFYKPNARDSKIVISGYNLYIPQFVIIFVISKANKVYRRYSRQFRLARGYN